MTLARRLVDTDLLVREHVAVRGHEVVFLRPVAFMEQFARLRFEELQVDAAKSPKNVSKQQAVSRLQRLWSAVDCRSCLQAVKTEDGVVHRSAADPSSALSRLWAPVFAEKPSHA